MGAPRVLVVEDHPLNRHLAADALRTVGYAVLEAEGPRDARVWLANTLPDLILLDIHLASADGLLFLRQLRGDPRTRGIPVVATTALAMKTDRDRILQAGCDVYLAKPFSPRALRQIVGELLPRPETPAEVSRG